MADLLSPRAWEFVKLVAGGVEPRDAHVAAGYACDRGNWVANANQRAKRYSFEIQAEKEKLGTAAGPTVQDAALLDQLARIDEALVLARESRNANAVVKLVRERGRILTSKAGRKATEAQARAGDARKTPSITPRRPARDPAVAAAVDTRFRESGVASWLAFFESACRPSDGDIVRAEEEVRRVEAVAAANPYYMGHAQKHGGSSDFSGVKLPPEIDAAMTRVRAESFRQEVLGGLAIGRWSREIELHYRACGHDAAIDTLLASRGVVPDVRK